MPSENDFKRKTVALELGIGPLINTLAAAFMSRVHPRVLSRKNNKLLLDVEAFKESFTFPLGLEVPPPHPYTQDSFVIAYVPTLSLFWCRDRFYECQEAFYKRVSFHETVTELEKDGFFESDMTDAFFSVLWFPMGEDTPHTPVLTYFSFNPIQTSSHPVAPQWERLPVVNALLNTQGLALDMKSFPKMNERAQTMENALFSSLRYFEYYTSDPMKPHSNDGATGREPIKMEEIAERDSLLSATTYTQRKIIDGKPTLVPRFTPTQIVLRAIIPSAIKENPNTVYLNPFVSFYNGVSEWFKGGEMPETSSLPSCLVPNEGIAKQINEAHRLIKSLSHSDFYNLQATK